MVDRLRVNAEFLSNAIDDPGPDDAEPLPASYNRLRRSMIAAEREAILQARKEGRYQERAVRAALTRIDVEETELDIGRPRIPD